MSERETLFNTIAFVAIMLVVFYVLSILVELFLPIAQKITMRRTFARMLKRERSDVRGNDKIMRDSVKHLRNILSAYLAAWGIFFATILTIANGADNVVFSFMLSGDLVQIYIPSAITALVSGVVLTAEFQIDNAEMRVNRIMFYDNSGYICVGENQLAFAPAVDTTYSDFTKVLVFSKEQGSAQELATACPRGTRYIVTNVGTFGRVIFKIVPIMEEYADMI